MVISADKNVKYESVVKIMDILPGQLIAKIVLSAVLVPPAIYLFVAIGKWLDKKPLVPIAAV